MKTRRNSAFFLLLFSLLCSTQVDSRAQSFSSAQRDSIRIAKRMAGMLDTKKTFTFQDRDFQVGIPALDSVRFDLHKFQLYDKSLSSSSFVSHRGNLAMPEQILEHHPEERSGFKYRTNLFSSWEYTVDNTPFYQTLLPYTRLYFVNNFGKNLNFFNVVHSQNVYRGLNFAIDFNVLDHTGQYVNSYSNHINLRVYGNYFSSQGRYKLLFGYIFNRERFSENGGIQNDADFSENILKNRLQIPVQISSGGGRWRENNFFIRQTYHIYADKKDSIVENDKSYGFVAHSFEFSDRKYVYKDLTESGTDFYEHFYLNDLGSEDSSKYLNISQKLYYSSADMDKIGLTYQLKFAAGFKSEIVLLRDFLRRDKLIHWYPFAQLQIAFKNRFVWDFYADYGLGNYNMNDLTASTSLHFLFRNGEQMLSKMDKITLKVGFVHAQPEWMAHRHFSNHFYWENDFNAEKELYAKLHMKYKGWWFRLNAALKSDHVMYKKNGPEQVHQWFAFGTLTLGKDVKFGKYVGLDNALMFAYSSNEQIMHLPLFSLKESLYGNIPIRKLAVVQMGFDFYYNTPYFADAYMPATGTYYWQDEVKTGNSLVVDFWVNFQIKQKFNLFVKLQNMTQGMIAYDYIYTPHYPIHDRCVRFGILWRFFD